jgi:hypothetical protein
MISHNILNAIAIVLAIGSVILLNLYLINRLNIKHKKLFLGTISMSILISISTLSYTYVEELKFTACFEEGWDCEKNGIQNPFNMR